MNNLTFYITGLGLGIGLSMDAFSVSLANGLHEPKMKLNKMLLISGTFAFFQALMPMIGWFLVHTLLEYFKVFEKFIPWIALVLLVFIGGKMLIEGLEKKSTEDDIVKLGVGTVFVQGIATSIDALSVGFTISGHDLVMALVTALIITAVTFIICFLGIMIGKKFGTHFSNKASVFGGVILIIIGIEIFLTGILG